MRLLTYGKLYILSRLAKLLLNLLIPRHLIIMFSKINDLRNIPLNDDIFKDKSSTNGNKQQEVNVIKDKFDKLIFKLNRS